jgi:hypothetical protein
VDECALRTPVLDKRERSEHLNLKLKTKNSKLPLFMAAMRTGCDVVM